MQATLAQISEALAPSDPSKNPLTLSGGKPLAPEAALALLLDLAAQLHRSVDGGSGNVDGGAAALCGVEVIPTLLSRLWATFSAVASNDCDDEGVSTAAALAHLVPPARTAALLAYSHLDQVFAVLKVTIRLFTTHYITDCRLKFVCISFI